MKKLSKIRIKRILEKHCVMAEAVFSRPEKDEYGDTNGESRYDTRNVYISQLLHRYNPYTELRINENSTTHKRRVPMAILPYDNPPDIRQGDTVFIKDISYSVSFVEDIKGYYYLLSLTPTE